MMRSFLALQYKELRQNALLFLVPAGVLFLLVSAASAGIFRLSLSLRDILAVAVPVALAVAFGLQTFDLEENNQTKDFLLTKPVTPGMVFAAKFLSGLVMLLLLALLWIRVLTPEAVRSPSFADYSTFWLTSCLFLLVSVYAACVLAGVLIKGPQKVLFGALLSALAAAWFFTIYYAVLSVILYTQGAAGPLWAWSVVAAGAALLIFLSFCLAGAGCRHLVDIQLLKPGRKMLICLAGLCALPLFAVGAGALAKPVIRPFSSLTAAFLSREEWFTAVTAVRQPNGDLYAFADAHGRLGLGRAGQKPRTVYQTAGKEDPLTALAWSPDGRSIAFHQDGLILLYDLKEGRTVPIMHGAAAFWSVDPLKMLVVGAAKDGGNRYEIYLADLGSGNATQKGSFTAFTGLNLAWDGARSQLLVLDRAWKLNLLGLETGAVRSVDLTPYPGCAERIFGSRFYQSADGIHRFAVFAADPVAPDPRRPLFNAHFYEFDPQHLILKPAGTLRNVFFQDLAGDPANNEMIGLIGLGVYRALSLPREGS